MRGSGAFSGPFGFEFLRPQAALLALAALLLLGVGLWSLARRTRAPCASCSPRISPSTFPYRRR